LRCDVSAGRPLSQKFPDRRDLGLPLAFLIALACGWSGCHLLHATFNAEGSHVLNPASATPSKGPYAVLFAIDGAGYGQLMDAINSGRAAHLQAMLGKPVGRNLYEHAYSAPDAFTVMPSCSTAGWTSIMTGLPPGMTGVTGDEFFVREQNRFYAPIPLSSRDSHDFFAAVDSDLIGKIIRVPTVYQRIAGPSYVSLLYVYHGATIYSTLGDAALLDLASGVIAGRFEDKTLRQSIAPIIDDGSVSELSRVLDEHGIPRLMVVYFPGPDIYAHGSSDPLPAQTVYLETHIDTDIGRVLDEYEKRGALDDTYVIIIADHGHTPVIDDRAHDLDAGGGGALSVLLEKTGFRVRPPGVELRPEDRYYQAVIADEGFSAYLYLADRSTCPHKGQTCDWRKPPRFRRDLMPVLRALAAANRSGRRVARMRGALDLIFARDYQSRTLESPPPLEIFDGRRLVPIAAYLGEHLRPDLVEPARRMGWLGSGPYGDRAGDIVVMAKAGMTVPIQQRYYFSIATYHAWHGSLSTQDAHIPLILASRGASGRELQKKLAQVAHDPPTALDVTPLIESLLSK
jgi:hypothetical protein